ncbi:zinc finger, C2H2 type, partial [Ostertagia ostertagi]
DCDFSEYEEEEEPQPRPRVRPKRKARHPSEESEAASISPSERRTNGHYSTRTSNSNKRRRIESHRDDEVSRSRRGRNTRRSVATHGEPSTSMDSPLSWVRRDTNDSLKDNSPWPCPIGTCLHVADAAVDLKRHLAMHQFHAHAQFVGLIIIGTKSDFKGMASHVMIHIDFLSSDDRVCDDESMALPQHRCLWENCYRQFENKGDLRLEIYIIHNFIHIYYKEKINKCPSGNTFDTTVERSTCACPFCGRFFSRPDKLYEHLRKRAPIPAGSENQHLCLLCQRRFGDERSLVNHVRRHINGRQCPTCGLAVQLPSDLHRHILVKHTERIKTLTCPECEKSFYCPTDLIRHSAVHAPPKELCTVCGERFRWKKQLDRHMTTHSVTALKQPYLCHICDSTYATGHGLTRHLSRKHECPIPEGFSRFSYKKCADGCYRLQTRKLVMWTSRIASIAARLPKSLGRRYLLSEAFSLEKEWASRHAEMTKLGLGGDYEWISAVQKKFIGGAPLTSMRLYALLNTKIQVDDVVELLYKLRHSENAADLPVSAEYALIRLLLRHDPSFLFKLADDPINYGIFMNEHAACLAIDHFIKRNDFGVLYSCTKWAELPSEEQTMPRDETEEEEVNDDDIKTFKFPYLKNAYFDSHFDLTDPHQLVGKTLLWVARDSRSFSEPINQSLRLLGAVLYNRLDMASTLASSSTHGGVADIIRQRFTPAEGEEPSEQQKAIPWQTGRLQFRRRPDQFSRLVKEKEEEALATQQKEEFTKWHKRRQELIKAQADRLLLKVRAEEIAKELAELEHHAEQLSFFENRLKWEKQAAQNAEIIQQTTSQENEVKK